MSRKIYRRSAIAAVVVAIGGLTSVLVATHFAGTDRRVLAQHSTGPTAAPPRVSAPTPSLASESILPSQAARLSTTQPAHVAPYEQAEILSKASGFVSRVHVDIGDSVEQDQLLAELWIPEMGREMLLKEAVVAEAKATRDQMTAAILTASSLLDAVVAERLEKQASVAQYESEVNFRRSEHDRIADLVAQKSLNEALLDEKRKWLRSAESALAGAQAAVASSTANIEVQKARLKQAEANERQALARIKVAEADLNRTAVLAAYARITAPFAGTITDRRIDTGDFVTSAESNNSARLFTLCRVDRLRIVVDIPESEASLIRLGQPVELRLDAFKGRSLAGAVQRTAGMLDARTRTLRIEAELDSPPPELRPGMFGMMTIDLSASAPPHVPQSPSAAARQR